LQITPPFIHHHGGATWYKNREAVIEVFLKCRARQPNLSLVLSGGHLSDQQKTLLQANDALGAVVECGAVTREVLEALYGSAAVFLFPSWCEGFGWPPVEAQACGCPVVASNAGSLAEVLQDSAVLFQPDDTEGMSEAVITVIKSPEKSQQLAEKGLKNAARFNFERMQTDYKNWCTTVCSRTASTAL
jgi:glycosyltransferase involved in cell wall biosynthesis